MHGRCGCDVFYTDERYSRPELLRYRWSGGWAGAFEAAYNYSLSNPEGGYLRSISTLTSRPTCRVIINANVNVARNSNTINMNSLDRAVFIAGGNVTISDLQILKGCHRGSGTDGGGAGAGLGGSIFIGNNTYNGTAGISTPDALSGVTFQSNQAVGGGAAGWSYITRLWRG